MGSVGFEELLVVALVAIIVFGKDLPSVARKAGAFYTKVKRQVNDVRDELQRQIPNVEEEDVSNSSTSPAPGKVEAPVPPPTAPDGAFDPSKPHPLNGDGPKAVDGTPATTPPEQRE